MEAEAMSCLNEIAAMPTGHMIGWTILIFGSPAAAWLGWMLGR